MTSSNPSAGNSKFAFASIYIVLYELVDNLWIKSNCQEKTETLLSLFFFKYKKDGSFFGNVRKTTETQCVVMHHGRCAWRFAVVAHSWTKHQKPAKNEILKIREIDWSYWKQFDKL